MEHVQYTLRIFKYDVKEELFSNESYSHFTNTNVNTTHTHTDKSFKHSKEKTSIKTKPEI